jgi:hypothetical protein
MKKRHLTRALFIVGGLLVFFACSLGNDPKGVLDDFTEDPRISAGGLGDSYGTQLSDPALGLVAEDFVSPAASYVNVPGVIPIKEVRACCWEKDRPLSAIFDGITTGNNNSDFWEWGWNGSSNNNRSSYNTLSLDPTNTGAGHTDHFATGTHFITIELNENTTDIKKLRYLPFKQDTAIAGYQIWIRSDEPTNAQELDADATNGWTKAAEGTWTWVNTSTWCEVNFDPPITAKYLQVRESSDGTPGNSYLEIGGREITVNRDEDISMDPVVTTHLTDAKTEGANFLTLLEAQITDPDEVGSAALTLASYIATATTLLDTNTSSYTVPQQYAYQVDVDKTARNILVLINQVKLAIKKNTALIPEDFVSPLTGVENVVTLFDLTSATASASACCWATTTSDGGGNTNLWGDDFQPYKAIDSNNNTTWSSNYEGGGTHPAGWDNRHWLTIDLKSEQQYIYQLEYRPRGSGDNYVTDYEIYIGNTAYTGDVAASDLAAKGTLTANQDEKTITLTPPKSGRYIQIRCEEGDASTEQTVGELRVKLITGTTFAGIETSYITTAYTKGQLELAALTAGTQNHTKLTALLATAESLKDEVTTGTSLDEKLADAATQIQIDAAALALIRGINKLRQGQNL